MVLVLHCSPRRNGNTDAAAFIVLTTLRERGLAVESLALREFSIIPCASCGYCSRRPGEACPFEARDDSAYLFGLLREATAICLAAPIYFYHLPAQLKAFIDRGQRWWTAFDAGIHPPVSPSTRRLWPLLIGARARGEHLFSGSLATLRCWLPAFGLELGTPLCLYGLDGADALLRHEDAGHSVAEFAAALADSLPDSGASGAAEQ